MLGFWTKEKKKTREQKELSKQKTERKRDRPGWHSFIYPGNASKCLLMTHKHTLAALKQNTKWWKWNSECEDLWHWIRAVKASVSKSTAKQYFHSLWSTKAHLNYERRSWLAHTTGATL